MVDSKSETTKEKKNILELNYFFVVYKHLAIKKKEDIKAAPTQQLNEKPNVLCLLFLHCLHSNGGAKQIAKMAICFLNSHFYI